MFTPQLADSIESLIVAAPEVQRYDRINDGEEFHITIKPNAAHTSVELWTAINLADVFDLNFLLNEITLHLQLPDER